VNFRIIWYENLLPASCRNITYKILLHLETNHRNAMKRSIRFFCLSILILGPHFPSMAQAVSDTIPGEYYLQGVMETASAVLLKPDHTFELYYSYGAVDRQGNGRWKFENNKIILNSRPWPKTDFKLVDSKSTGDDLTTVRIAAGNGQLLPYFEAMIRGGDGEKSGKTNAEGILQIPKSKVKAIDLFFTLCPERYSTIPIQSEDNYFEFKPEPWIAEIFLENVTLNVTNEGLTGEHPLLKGNEFLYTKAK